MAMLTAARRRRNGVDRVLPVAFPGQRPAPGVLRGPLRADLPASHVDLALNQPAHSDLHRLPQSVASRNMFGRALRERSLDRAARLDVAGQLKVADMLAQLDHRWHVLHAVPLAESASTIDHVVVGPGGVYSLSSRHHPGSSVLVAGDLFMVDGRRFTYTATARDEAVAGGLRLSGACGFLVRMKAVVVPVGADDFLVKRAPLGVGVVPRARINRWLDEQPVTLTEAEIADIYVAARRSDVWR